MGANLAVLLLFLFIIGLGILGFLFGKLRPRRDITRQRHEARLEAEGQKFLPDF